MVVRQWLLVLLADIVDAPKEEGHSLSATRGVALKAHALRGSPWACHTNALLSVFRLGQRWGWGWRWGACVCLEAALPALGGLGHPELSRPKSCLAPTHWVVVSKEADQG